MSPERFFFAIFNNEHNLLIGPMRRWAGPEDLPEKRQGDAADEDRELRVVVLAVPLHERRGVRLLPDPAEGAPQRPHGLDTLPHLTAC